MVASDLLQLTKSTTTDPMLAPTDYLAALQSYMEPSNGTVPYTYARICARLLHLSEEFQTEYSCMEGYRVDVGEFNVWALNLL
jgi:hypothetical protein